MSKRRLSPKTAERDVCIAIAYFKGVGPGLLCKKYRLTPASIYIRIFIVVKSLHPELCFDPSGRYISAARIKKTHKDFLLPKMYDLLNRIHHDKNY